MNSLQACHQDRRNAFPVFNFIQNFSGHRHRLSLVRARYTGRNLAEKVRGANEEAWKDMVGASQKAFVELQRGWADAVSRFQ
jgi:hypothetical protein